MANLFTWLWIVIIFLWNTVNCGPCIPELIWYLWFGSFLFKANSSLLFWEYKFTTWCVYHNQKIKHWRHPTFLYLVHMRKMMNIRCISINVHYLDSIKGFRYAFKFWAAESQIKHEFFSVFKIISSKILDNWSYFFSFFNLGKN